MAHFYKNNSSPYITVPVKKRPGREFQYQILYFQFKRIQNIKMINVARNYG